MIESHWWNRPLRVLQFNIEDAYGFYADKITADTLVSLAKKIHANTLIVFARDAWGRVFYAGSSLYPRHPTSRLDVKELVEKANKNNIKVIVMAAHTANRYIYRLHPDWAQKNAKGEVVVLEHYPRAKKVVDPHWPQICPNSPAMDLYFIPEVEEAVRITRADGLLLDSFRYLPDPPRACFCEHCRRKFKHETGFDLPVEANIEDIAFREAWEWRLNVNVRSISRLREAAKRAGKTAGKEILFFYNSHPIGWAGRGNIVVDRSREYLDAVFAEASEVDVRGPGMLTIASKLTQAVLGEGKPVFVSRNAFYDLRPPQSVPGPALRIGLYEIAASGGQPQVTMFSSQFFSDPRALEAVEEAFSVLERVEEYLENLDPISHVYIVFDTETHEKYYWNKPEYYVGEVEGFALIAMHRHIPWRFISSRDLNRRDLHLKAPVLVAAGMAVIDDATEDVLAGYVENGGTLIATHEFGVMRPDYTYREALALQNIMDVKYEGVLWLGYSYLHLGRPGEPVYDTYWTGLPEAVPFGDHSTAFIRERVEPKLGEIPRIVPGDKVKVLARARLGRSAYGYEYTLGRSAPAPDSVLHLAGITLTEYGRGRIVYYAHLLGSHYTRLGHPDYAELFERILRRHAPPLKIRVEAPETVQSEPYKQGEDRIVVHLVNHTYNQKFLSTSSGPSKQALPSFEPSYRVHPIRQVIPVGPILVKLADDIIETGKTSELEAFDAITGQNLKVEKEQDKIKITLPILNEYSIIVIQNKK